MATRDGHGAPTAAELAAAALDAVGRDPAGALGLADAAVLSANRAIDPDAAATAHRAAALALRELGELGAAARRARSAVGTAVSPPVIAEARMTSAFILLETGRVRAALHQADRAAAGSTGLSAARVASQRALILQRRGRLDEALAGYAEALPVFRRHRDRLWEARLLNNRGQLHADQGALVAATADFTAGRSLFERLDLPALASDVEWNLAGVAALQGDVPLALARLESVRSAHVVRGTPNPQLQIDRAETLLSVGLAAEAQAEAAAAVVALTLAGQHVDLPHAVLVHAHASADVGDHDAAATGAGRARQLFRRQDRPGWAALSALAAVRATELAGGDDRQVLAAARRVAAEVQRAGWPLAEMDARLIAARSAGRLGREPERRRQLALAARYRRLGTVDARLRGWYAEALLREATGNRRGARVALAAAMRVLDQQQALLGATELRAHVSAIGSAVVAMGIEMALTAGTPREVWRWTDTGRARATRPRPVRPPRDEVLTQALSVVRLLHAQTVQAQLDGAAPPPIADRRRAERDVVSASRRIAGGRGSAAPMVTSAALTVALADRVLVEFVEHAGRLSAVVVADGRFEMQALGSVAGLETNVQHVHFAAHRVGAGFGTHRSRSLMNASLQTSAAELEDRLLPTLAARWPDRELVVVPSAGLHSVLWSMLPGLRSRVFAVAPSAAAWLQAVSTPDPSAAGSRPVTAVGTRPLLVAGPGLPGADTEIRAVAATRPDAVVMRHPHATTAAVLAAMDGAPLAHIAAHGALRTDNPMFSALLMEDGPLTVYDIEGLRSAPDVVVLSSCESGVGAARAGDELLGLVAALVSIGTRSIVATGLRTPDETTGAVMLMLHRGLLTGVSPAAALAGVRRDVDPDDLSLTVTAGGFACFGSAGAASGQTV